VNTYIPGLFFSETREKTHLKDDFRARNFEALPPIVRVRWIDVVDLGLDVSASGKPARVDRDLSGGRCVKMGRTKIDMMKNRQSRWSRRGWGRLPQLIDFFFQLF
jgi:hypothetical protein